MTMSTKDAAPEAQAQAALTASHVVTRKDHRFLWWWLFIATTFSFIGNVGHAVMVHSVTTNADALFWLAILWAAAPPTLLMLAVHGVPVTARFLQRTEDDRVLVSVAWLVTCAAFIWSAYGLFAFTVAVGVPESVAWIAPLAIDLSVFGATRALVRAAPVMARMKAGITHVEPREPSHEPPMKRTTPQREPSHEPPMKRPVEPREPSHEPPMNRPVERSTAFQNRPVSRPVGQRDPLVLTHDAETVAQMVVERTTITQPIKTIVKVLDLAMDGASLRDIAKSKLVSASTAGRIITAARELDAADRQLTAV